ncbi:MAG: Asp-tRNA(Asn)/Glu-tRNA(Gln) amidotransferase GatCAB subunit C [Deltaproteobacteria bacterium CG11_big_fil_rev_8_21_14_0_20_47_16]|nr:MAG: Asp-tRNA(Asn)/Glu-tRNA(Gln) amidotransferase GatCAB subunit C [Deltaproteobacteria bacterium CG11_big_fil_rev_8_21_14_0_20_47_16]
MTDINKKLIDHIAHLARLRFPEADLERYTQKAKHILEYVERLKAVNTEGIEPTAHAVDAVGFMRDDEAQAFDNREAILANAPERDGDFFQVPKVL